MAPVTPGVTPASVTGRGRERGCDDGDDRWVPPVGEEGRKLGYRFGAGWNGPRAPFFSGPNRFPKVQIDFYFFFLPFLFWISDLSF
jgi:hypothetical protein